MKKMRNMLTVIACLFTVITVKAQEKGEVKLNLNYNYSMPVGAFKNDLISNVSPRGASGSIMYGFNNKLAAGLYVGYQDYYQKYPRTVYQTGKNQYTSAVLSNSIQTMPFMAKAKFSPVTTGFLRPYITAAAGGNVIDFRQYLGEFGGSETSVSFAAQGGVGIEIPFGRLSSSGFHIGATYNYVPYTRNGYKNLNAIDLQAGISIPLR
jgi:hypothetical protein